MEIISVKTSEYAIGVNGGEICLLTGKAGCGKTTLLKRITRLCATYEDFNGEITLLGKDIKAYSEKELTDTIGYIPQNIEGSFVCKRVYDELCFHLRNQGLNENEIAQRGAFLCGELPLLPLLHRDIDALSDGQKALVALGGVIITTPKLLLLDEPCDTMDKTALNGFITLIHHLCKNLNMAVIIATHTPELFKIIADKEVCLSPIADNPIAKPQELAGKTQVKISNLLFGYERQSIIIDNLNVSFESGRIYALTGLNGCGKTTLLKLICGMLKPQRGQIKNTGRAIYLPCALNDLFIKDTLYDDICFALNCNGIAHSEIGILMNKYPFFGDISGLFSKNPLDLSGGELRCAALFKALLLNPDIICLDEPTCGLDKDLSRKLMTMLYEICKDKTVILSTHSRDIMNLCHSRLLLFNGQIAANDSPEAVARKNIFGGKI